MKKLLMVALFAIVAVGASAQKNWTIWWGGNVADLSGDWDTKSEFKALNIGVSYTAPIADAFDWSAGVSYTTKGAKDWDPGFIQLEGNGAWNFVNSDEAKVGLFTGPYLGFMVTDDDMPNANTVDFGWQGGVVARRLRKAHAAADGADIILLHINLDRVEPLGIVRADRAADDHEDHIWTYRCSLSAALCRLQPQGAADKRFAYRGLVRDAPGMQNRH